MGVTPGIEQSSVFARLALSPLACPLLCTMRFGSPVRQGAAEGEVLRHGPLCIACAYGHGVLAQAPSLLARRPTCFPVSRRLSHCDRGFAEDYEGPVTHAGAHPRGLSEIIKVLILGVVHA